MILCFRVVFADEGKIIEWISLIREKQKATPFFSLENYFYKSFILVLHIKLLLPVVPSAWFRFMIKRNFRAKTGLTIRDVSYKTAWQEILRGKT